MITVTKNKQELLAVLGEVRVKGGGIEDLMPLSRIAAHSEVSFSANAPSASELSTEEKITYASALELSDIANVYIAKLTNNAVTDINDVLLFDTTAATHDDGWYRLPKADFEALTDPKIVESHYVEDVANTVTVIFEYDNA